MGPLLQVNLLLDAFKLLFKLLLNAYKLDGCALNAMISAHHTYAIRGFRDAATVVPVSPCR